MPPFLGDREDKVRGKKVYGRDFNTRDLGWEGECRHAYLLRVTHADRKYLGLDDARLGEVFAMLGVQPPDIFQAADLHARGFTAPYRQTPPGGGRPRLVVHPAQGLALDDPSVVPDFSGVYWLTPPGGYADHIGQPVAILLFKESRDLRRFATWNRERGPRDGRPVLRFDASSRVEWQQDIQRLVNPLLDAKVFREEALYGATHFIRSQVPDHAFSAQGHKDHDPDALGPDVDPAKRAINLKANKAREAIRRSVAEEGMTVMRRTFFSQSIDPMFMELETGLAFLTRDEEGRPVMRIAAGTQSPRKDQDGVETLTTLWPQDEAPRVELKTFPIGGGFGGRDLSTFPIYLALAAFFCDGPVRLAFDRYEQFLCGIKRHAAVLQNVLAYGPRDPQGPPPRGPGDYVLHSLDATLYMDGGGVLNLTKPVVQLCALHAAGPYRFTHNAISGYGISTNGAPSGSMRGFGIPQAAFAIESMIDEVASTVGVDPIAFRREKLLQAKDVDVTGFELRHRLDTERICELAAQEPLWTGREARRAEYAARGNGLVKYGVGFACAMQAIGTSEDAVFAEVSISATGEVTVRSTAIEMGQGSETSLAIAPRPLLGREASRVVMGVLGRFDHETIRLNRAPYAPGQPRNTPKLDNTMSASVTAFFHLHAVEEAARVVFEHGLKPCAEALWGDVPESARWEDGKLVAPGREPIALEELACRAHARAKEDGLCTGAIVHTYYRNAYACSEYTLRGTTRLRYIDGLAVRHGGDDEDVTGYEHVTRVDVPYDGVANDARHHIRSVYASAGHLVAVTVNTRSGVIDVVDAVTLLDAGDVHHQRILEGQVEGGFAMGLGMTLFENIPPAPVGVDGLLNLHRYPVPRATHMPSSGIQLRLLPIPEGEQILRSGPPIRKKGIAEAVMTTVMPAIANAVAHATGARLGVLPFTPARVLEALKP
ncbi:molybdopterin-dependent oxidoreductase [Corallococcus sp. BB11-1]|uniref:xanthine dehydrogenase family protein molybdopterin-binding subunit n=1 Tax=Corallococcus sp. BB11-1 TaxID=2996783 RepID=UPI0022716347|nr:molybdopterin cofactor-binding domain-containing protein [Corallococcus sp. BB11-1]MCY1032871.1 molybdopterin-dependent oxidoreductase [Corallococcus sp. BB11-1]